MRSAIHAHPYALADRPLAPWGHVAQKACLAQMDGTERRRQTSAGRPDEGAPAPAQAPGFDVRPPGREGRFEQSSLGGDQQYPTAKGRGRSPRTEVRKARSSEERSEQPYLPVDTPAQPPA